MFGYTSFDLIRAVVIATGSALIGMTIVVIYVYHRAWVTTGRRGLVPHHVWLIALAHVLLVALTTVETVLRLGMPATWRLFFSMPAGILSLLALIKILTYERRRIHMRTETRLSVTELKQFDIEE